MEVLFSFYPRKAIRYREKVVFEMNKCAKQVVEILGQGTEMKVIKFWDLNNPTYLYPDVINIHPPLFLS